VPELRAHVIVIAYLRGERIQDICDTFGVSRTEVKNILKGVKRGMNRPSATDEEVAALYALLYSSQLEIERLRQEVERGKGGTT
jgi:hypothetical protein